MVPKTIDNESGYALVFAIVLLAVLMIAGVMSSTNSVNDLSITRNTAMHVQNSSLAESAAMTAVQLIENIDKSADLSPSAQDDDFIVADPNDSNYSAQYKTEKWVEATAVKTFNHRAAGSGSPTYMVIGWTQAQGASLGQYASTLKEGRVIGRYISDQYGVYRVELGFKKRF